jgi:hypothetical protein
MKTNDILITSNATLLIGYLFVFQASFANDLIRLVLLFSFILLVGSLISLIWYKIRYPIREKIHKEMRDKAISKAVDGIESYMKGYVRPLATLETRTRYIEKLLTVKNEKEHKKFINDLEDEKRRLKSGDTLDDIYPKSEELTKAQRAISESFTKNILYETQDGFDAAFRKPLKERLAKPKYYIDLFTFKLRVHLFVAGCTLLVVCVAAQLTLAS